MDHTWNWMIVLKDLLATMNRGGKSLDEEERVRHILREVMRENSNASASERDMMHRMMQLLEHNVTKHTAELQATAQERDLYKTKMEELNLRMEQMCRDGGAHPSGGEGSGLKERQRRLAEIWEELQDMRQSKRSDQTTEGKPFNKGRGRGVSGASGASDRRHWNQSQNERTSEFGRQNKGGTPYFPGMHPSQGRDSEKLETSLHKDFKSGGFQSKPFQQDNRYQEGPMSSSKTFTQHGGRGGRRDFGPYSSNTHDNHGLQSYNRHWQGDSGSGFSDRDAIQNVGMQNHGPNRGSYQHRGRYNDRGQNQQRRGQCNPHRGQSHQHRGRSQDGRQDQRSIASGSRNPSGDFSPSQFTPDEIEAIKSVLKEREAGAECTGKSGSPPLLVNPSKTAAKKKEQKKPKGAVAMLPDDSDSDKEDAFKSSKEGMLVSGDAGDKCFDIATDAKPVSDSKKKKKANKKGNKDQAATQHKPEGLSPLEVFTASGFDVSQVAGMNMDQAVSDLMLITKEDGNIVSCQPKTVRELVEFKQQYPNAQVIIVKTSD